MVAGMEGPPVLLRAAAPTATAEATPAPVQQLVPTHLIERNIVIVGPSGSGKSQIINAISVKDVELSDICPYGVTRDPVTESTLIQIPYNNEMFCLRLFDTRGLTDSHQSFVSLLPKWNEMIQRSLTKIHLVLFVIPVDRLSKSLLVELEKMFQALAEWGMQPENVVVVLNKCDFFQKEKLERYEARLRSLVNVPKVIKEAPLIRTCFLNPKDVIPQMQAAVSELFQHSRRELLVRLLSMENVVPFFPQVPFWSTYMLHITRWLPKKKTLQHVLGAFACGTLFPFECGLVAAIFPISSVVFAHLCGLPAVRGVGQGNAKDDVKQKSTTKQTTAP